ncbi:MFS transporter [Dongia sp. agr-C8]
MTATTLDLPTGQSHRKIQLRWLGGGHFLAHFSMLIFATAALEMGPEYGATYGARLALATGGFIAFGALAVAWGWLADRRGAPGLLKLFAWGVAATLAMAAFAPATPGLGAVWLAVALTGIGVAGAIYHPVANSVIAGWGAASGSAFALNGVFGNVGIAMAPLATAGLIALFGWRAAFVIPAIAAVALAFSQPPGLGFGAHAEAAARSAAPAPGTIRIALVILSILAAVDGVIFNLATIALPKLLSERGAAFSADPQAVAASLGTIGLIGSIVTLFGAGAQILVGRLLARWSALALLAPAAAMQVLGGLLMASDSLYGFGAGLLLLFMAIFALATLGDAAAALVLPPAFRGRGYALLYLLSFLSGAVAAPLAAYLADHGGMVGAAGFIFGFGLVSLAGAAFLAWRRRLPQTA